MTLYPIKIDFRSVKICKQKINLDKYRLLSVFIEVLRVSVQGAIAGKD
ncbi:hypothetical protein C4K04_0337 [Pseudomonas chlororaphis]|uniref:Uncharacterized protein n=2 Tax=Pseudomonas chlororaphis TaxID=587753 RepID=A0A3G7TGS0_9PSED|nr:hypothetical protein C4K04_0337 [Pseudomonas chlororaphis]